MLDLVLKNADLPDGTARDIGIRRGKVFHVGAAKSAGNTIDCSGLLCIPGAVDMHVHMRGGIERHKEDWKTGSMSAIAGGVTLVIDQPNTIPPLTTKETFMDRVHEAEKESFCHFGINGGVVEGSDLKGLWHAGAMAFGEIFLAASTHGLSVPPEIVRKALFEIQKFGGLSTLHAENSTPRPSSTLKEHDQGRSVQAELEKVLEIFAMAPDHARLHFCHLSSPVAIDATPSTCEVTPHHLMLSYEDFPPGDARGKVNPPLRSETVRRELWSRWNRIDVIASDHAPHTKAEKEVSFGIAPAGLPGVETMVPLLIAEVLRKKITLASLIQKTSLIPSRILGIAPSGFSVGCRADFALFPRTLSRIDPSMLHSRCAWTPYEGWEAVFPKLVILDGACVYREGEFLERRGRWYRGRGYIETDAI